MRFSLAPLDPENGGPYQIQRWLSEAGRWEVTWQLTIFGGIRVQIHRVGSGLLCANLCAGKETLDAVELTDLVLRYLAWFDEAGDSFGLEREYDIERAIPKFEIKPLKDDPTFLPEFRALVERMEREAHAYAG